MRWLDGIVAVVRNLLGADTWGPFDLEAWRDLPHVAARLGTEADVKEGRAVFFLAGGEEPAAPHDMALPARAVHHDETAGVAEVVIIQAERSGDRVLVGFRYPAGGNGIATLDEIKFPSSPGRPGQ